MTSREESAGAYGEAVQYMERTREYYAAQGFEKSYRWARHDAAPFQALTKPLAESRLVLITTANEPAPEGWRPGERRPPRRVHSVERTAPPEGFYTDDLSWHKEATHTDDLGSYFPLAHLEALVDEGRLGNLTTRMHGIPTEYSQRRTLASDAPEVLRRCREDGADVALLVPL
ncbi:MAG: hypothetical protein AAF690_13125 [Acidobacteriota bacterium]